jgi:hypothetical protein
VKGVEINPINSLYKFSCFVGARLKRAWRLSSKIAFEVELSLCSIFMFGGVTPLAGHDGLKWRYQLKVVTITREVSAEAKSGEA